MASPPTSQQPLELTLLATLPSPSGPGSVRTWSAAPYPASSPSTPLLAIASSDKSVSIFSLRDFRLLSTITGGHKRSVRCVGWKDWGSNKRKRADNGGGDGDSDSGGESKSVILATGSFDANVGVWVHDAEYSSRLQQGHDALTTNNTSNANTSSSAALEYGVGIDESSASITNDADSDDEEWHFSTLLTGPDSEIKSLAFSPPHYSANMLATSSRDKSVWVWEEVEPDEWETIAVLQEHTGDVKCVVWNKGARRADDGMIVGGREILASASYDDTVRLWRDVEEEGDWVCVGVLEGHGGTVWGVCWESFIPAGYDVDGRERWEARLVSCSDDLSVRIWRRVVSEAERTKMERDGAGGGGGGKPMPSILRPASSMERWELEAVLPSVHVRSVYAVDWSEGSGLVVSCGGDGVLAIYKEVLDEERQIDGDLVMNGTSDVATNGEGEIAGENNSTEKKKTKWIIVAQVEAAHDEFEINHVCWALRRDAGKRFEGEEIIVSTGDDGVVRLWTLPEGIL